MLPIRQDELIFFETPAANGAFNCSSLNAVQPNPVFPVYSRVLLIGFHIIINTFKNDPSWSCLILQFKTFSSRIEIVLSFLRVIFAKISGFSVNLIYYQIIHKMTRLPFLNRSGYQRDDICTINLKVNEFQNYSSHTFYFRILTMLLFSA